MFKHLGEVYGCIQLVRWIVFSPTNDGIRAEIGEGQVRWDGHLGGGENSTERCNTNSMQHDNFRERLMQDSMWFQHSSLFVNLQTVFRLFNGPRWIWFRRLLVKMYLDALVNLHRNLLHPGNCYFFREFSKGILGGGSRLFRLVFGKFLEETYRKTTGENEDGTKISKSLRIALNSL